MMTMEYFVLIALVVTAGWLLGIVGFFQARRARRDLALLRRSLAAGDPVTAEIDPLAAYHAELARGAAAEASAQDQAARPSPFGSRPELAPSSVPPVGPVGPAPEEAAAPAFAEPPPLPPPPPPVGPRIDIETLLTQRWGVWLGAAALLLAGVFLVRYAVEEGWLGPEVRCALAMLLGVALLAGAEWLRRRPAPEAARAEEAALADPAPAAPLVDPAPAAPLADHAPAAPLADHAPAALAAGGAAVLFGAAYATGAMYALVPPPVGFALMALAALVGIAASMRFGPVVGLVGVAAAFATPLLVEVETPSAPGLFAYLLFVTAAACVVVRLSAWAWLGWIATIAGALWVALAATGQLGTEYWAPGLFVPAAAALHLLLLPRAALDHAVGRRLSWVPFLALGLAGVVLSGEVPDFAVRAGVLLLAPLAVAKGAREPALDRLPWLAAVLFVLTLLMWAMPAWQSTGEVITIDGAVLALLPGIWAPQVIQPLLYTAAAMAAFFAAAGLMFERRAANPVRWAALTAAVPVITLAVTYLQVARFQPDPLWALAAVALAAGLTAAAAAAVREGSLQRAGTHAAGAVAALCLGAAIVLHDHWVTLAVALFLPPLAWIEARADLRPLRRVALAVASLVLVRLLLNWYVLDYSFGTTPIVNGLVLAYALPAACFALAARMFLRRGDDLTVAVLEAGAIAFATVFVALEIRHWHAAGDLSAGGDLLEIGLHVSALAVQAVAGLFLARRTGRRVFAATWRIQGVVAGMAGAVLLIANPIWADLRASHAALVFAYLIPAVLAGLAMTQRETRPVLKPLGVYALVAGFVWLTLEIRLLFHPGEHLGRADQADAELWTYSGVWLAYGGALMAAGIRLNLRAVRLAALAVIAVVVAKVFLLDMADLGGLWRVLSFLGLGLSLIALGAIFRRFVVSPPSLSVPPPVPETPPAPP